MLSRVVGVVLTAAAFGPDAQELGVEVEGDVRRALNYVALTGVVHIGDTVLLNTTAQELSLGTGGFDFVMATLVPLPRAAAARRGEATCGSGHIIKGRYLPCQLSVLTLEEQPEYAAVWDKQLDGFPVVVGQLHSQIAPVAAALCLRGKRVAYVMTDAAALPFAFSRLARQLVDAQLLTATFTCGQAFGGQYETVTLHSALLAAKYVAGCDAAIVCQGPGQAGTGTRTGFSGMEQAANCDIAAALGGSPVAVVRMSDADKRERHRGVSHHTRTSLEMVRSRVRVAVPAGVDVPADIAARHDVAFVAETDAALELLAKAGIMVTSMGRGVTQDPLFFAAAAAAGMLA